MAGIVVPLLSSMIGEAIFGVIGVIKEQRGFRDDIESHRFYLILHGPTARGNIEPTVNIHKLTMMQRKDWWCKTVEWLASPLVQGDL